MKKGEKMSPEMKKNLSRIHLNSFANGRTPWNKGTKGLVKKNRGNFKKGSVPWNAGTAKINKCVCGKILKDLRTKMCRNCFSGENNHAWKGGISKRDDYKAFMQMKRKTAKLDSCGNYSLSQWDKLKKKYNFTCLCCKQQEPFIKLSPDHVMPLSRGGSDDISNIQPLCRSCNFRKHIKTTDYRLRDFTYKIS